MRNPNLPTVGTTEPNLGAWVSVVIGLLAVLAALTVVLG